MIDCMLANAAAGDPESIKALALLRVLGFDDEQLRNTFQRIAEPPKRKVEEMEIWEILDMCVEGSKQRKRDYWKQRNSK